jgi:hypothetical protein
MRKLHRISVLAVLCLAAVGTRGEERAAPRAVPTFECVGLYWAPPAGAPDKVCQVSYRREGEGRWSEALPLWFDARDREYRGSIVKLRPGSKYEISLRLKSTDVTVPLRAETWPDNFPIAKTVSLPANSDRTLTIAESGSSAGYVLYAPGAIDVAGNSDYCVVVKASHVILRGLTLKNARIHGIYLAEGAHDVVIENCDISGWGRVMEDGWGKDYDSAIYSRSARLTRVVVQRNRIHDPRSNSNSWRQSRPRPGKREPTHPEGPQAVCFWDSDGNHVIRYNTVWSDDAHQYNDVFGAGANFSTRGFPNCDSDIYGNLLSHCCDDAIESEGANRNVRIWGNYLTECYVGVACASTSIGPLYVWRNINAVSRVAPGDSAGGFLKTSDKTGGGRVYVFHNTILQPPGTATGRTSLGAGVGLGWGGPITNCTSRNNILHVTRQAIIDRAGDSLGDYDYDLIDAPRGAPDGQEKHAVRGTPVYVPGSGLRDGKGHFQLAPGTPGFDAGVPIPNFNDNFNGSAPDVGAHEAGEPPMEFGADAYRR